MLLCYHLEICYVYLYAVIKFATPCLLFLLCIQKRPFGLQRKAKFTAFVSILLQLCTYPLNPYIYTLPMIRGVLFVFRYYRIDHTNKFKA